MSAIKKVMVGVQDVGRLPPHSVEAEQAVLGGLMLANDAWDDGQTASISLWWAFVHILSKGMTNTAVAAIPCIPDWQSIATEVDLQEIEDQALRLEVGEFQLACYGAARNKLFHEQPKMDCDLASDTAWLGSQHLLSTPGFYDAFYCNPAYPGISLCGGARLCQKQYWFRATGLPKLFGMVVRQHP